MTLQIPLAHSLPGGSVHLDAPSEKLVSEFADAMRVRLLQAQVERGMGTAWERPGWMEECRTSLLAAVRDGNPVDVANYAAFLWHHNDTANAESRSSFFGLNGVDFLDTIDRLQASYPMTIDTGSGLIDSAPGAAVRFMKEAARRFGVDISSIPERVNGKRVESAPTCVANGYHQPVESEGGECD